MKALFIYDCLYPESLGGVEHRNSELAHALAARGHEVTLAGFTDRPRQLGPGVRVVSMGRAGRLYGRSGRRRGMAALRLAWAAAGIDLAGFDVVETANIPYAHLFPLALRCRLARKPLLVTWHEHWGRYWREYTGILWPLYAAVEICATRLGAAAIADSGLTARRLQAWRKQPVPVLPVGIPLPHIRAAAAGAARGAPPLVYAGRLQREKRLDLLLRAVALLPPKAPLPTLSVIGAGPDGPRLQALARESGAAGRIEFIGKLVDSADVWRRIAGARIAVQPSEREGFGLFPLEAMACGLPVVYCQSPESALPELVRDGVEGVSVPADAAALATALARLLDDEGELARLRDGALRRAAEFDWPAIAERFEGILLKLLPQR